MTRRARDSAGEAVAHLRHPLGDGTLCGRPPTQLRPCAPCLARRASLARVHVQSLRKPAEAFCGIIILPGGSTHPVAGPRDIAPMYVRAEQARGLLTSGSGLEFCPGCRGNLERHDDASRRRVQQIVGVRPAQAAAPAPAAAGPRGSLRGPRYPVVAEVPEEDEAL